MATSNQPVSGHALRDLWALARYEFEHVDRPAWRRFFLAIFGLGMAFVLALYSSALRESGRTEAAAWVAGLSLLMTAVGRSRWCPIWRDARRSSAG